MGMGLGQKYSYYYSYMSEHIKNVLLYFSLKITHFLPLMKSILHVPEGREKGFRRGYLRWYLFL